MKRVRGHRLQGWLPAGALHLGLLGWLFLGEAPPPRAVAKRPPVRVVLLARPQPPAPPQARTTDRPPAPLPPSLEPPLRPRRQRKQLLTAVASQAPRPSAPSPAAVAPPPPGTPRFQVALSATIPGGGVAVPTAPAGSTGRSVGVPRWAEGGAAGGGGSARSEAAPVRAIDASDASRVPELLVQPGPEELRRAYPERARAEGLEANVVLRILVSTEGRVQAVRLVRGAGNGFDEAAQRLVRTFRFRAGSRDGRAVAVWIPWTYKFRLNG